MRFAFSALWLLLLFFSIFFLQSYSKAVGAGGRIGGGGKIGGWKFGGRSGSIGRRSSRFKWNDSGRKSSYRLAASRNNYRPVPSRRPALMQPHSQFYNPLYNVPLLPYLAGGQPALRDSLVSSASYQPQSSVRIGQLSAIRQPDLTFSLTPWHMCQLCLSGDRSMKADEFDSHLSMCHMCMVTKCCLAPTPDTFS